ncbi:uncharacterized protein TNCV_3513881 [Trichonephila clavipes]|nr:uncharacterized protein TNCV_3513881 [Trichonephila clavipes]
MSIHTYTMEPVFVEWAQNEIAVVPDFHKRILFSDEAHFWLNGYVNKQNCCIWSEADPQVYVETPLHPEKLTVWCALWAGGIIGPYFFKNDEGHNITVNGDRFRAMITNFFIPELNNHDVQELWFHQDGVTCHTVRATIDLLKDTILRFGPVNWPPRSCDLTPLDYFLWGYVKSLVYADKPQTLDHLEDNIRRVIAYIRQQMLENSSKIGRPDWITSEPAVAVISEMCTSTDFDNGPGLRFIVSQHYCLHRRDPMTVSRIWNRWVQDCNVGCRAASQRPPITNSRENRHVIFVALMDHAVTSRARVKNWDSLLDNKCLHE